MAASVAVRMRENSFRAKFERYTRSDPGSADRKRKAYVAVAHEAAFSKLFYWLLLVRRKL